MSTYIREKLPVILVAVLAVLSIVLGAVSAATAQNLNHNPSLAPWEGINGEPALQQWDPMTSTHTGPSGMRRTLIGRAGSTPVPPAPLFPPQRLEPVPDLPSLADDKNNYRADPNTAQRANSLRQRRVEAPKPVPDFEALHLNNGELRSAEVQIKLSGKNDDKEPSLSWRLNPVELPIFIDKVRKLQVALSGNVTTEKSNTIYSHIEVSLLGNKGQVYQPVKIYQNKVDLPANPRPHEDQNRDLELWLLGTAKTFGQKDQIANLIHIWSYEDCKALNHTLVDSVPRQCVLPDGTTFLEIDKKLSQKDKEITTFDKCLKAGHPLIVSFPRKCVAPGGRVYIEPPRL